MGLNPSSPVFGDWGSRPSSATKFEWPWVRHISSLVSSLRPQLNLGFLLHPDPLPSFPISAYGPPGAQAKFILHI